jgi:hypothetical protein
MDAADRQLMRYALREAIDSVETALSSCHIPNPKFRTPETDAAERKYEQRLAEYKKLLIRMGGQIRGDKGSYAALRKAMA